MSPAQGAKPHDEQIGRDREAEEQQEIGPAKLGDDGVQLDVAQGKAHRDDRDREAQPDPRIP